MAESQSPRNSLDVHQSCGNIQNVSQRPQLQSSLQCGYSTSLPEMLRDVIIAPYGCCDPHDRIIASQSRPSSRGVQAGPISKHLSEEAVGCEHVDAAGTDACLCALLPISGSQGRNGGVQGTGGGRSAGLAHKISFSTLSQYC